MDQALRALCLIYFENFAAISHGQTLEQDFKSKHQTIPQNKRLPSGKFFKPFY